MKTKTLEMLVKTKTMHPEYRKGLMAALKIARGFKAELEMFASQAQRKGDSTLAYRLGWAAGSAIEIADAIKAAAK